MSRPLAAAITFVLGALESTLAAQDGPVFVRLPILLPFETGLARAGDLNGDGRLDLVVSGTLATFPVQPTPLAILLGRGEGDFGPPALLPVGDARITALELADLDADGHLDLLAPGFAILMSRGDGSFEAPQPFLIDILAGQTSPDLLALADVDHDGLLDYAAVDVWGVRVGLGQGDGHFKPAQTLKVYQSSNHHFVSLADLDGNGHVDVIAGAAVDGFEAGLYLFPGRGDGSFGRMRKLVGITTRPALADFNGDGHLDVAGLSGSGFGGGARLSISVGRGDGSFLHPIVSEFPGWLPAWTVSLRALDLDRSGPLDLVAMPGWVLSDGADDPALLTLTALGGGEFGRARTFSTPDFGPYASANDATDLDGDGSVDLLLPLGAGHEVTWMKRGETPFVDLGHALPGPAGAPTLSGSGVPEENELITLEIGAAPDGAGLLVVGLQPAMVGLQGGTLVPAPDLVFAVPAGAPLTARWPELPAGLAVYVQAWWLGGAAAASNALGIVGQ